MRDIKEINFKELIKAIEDLNELDFAPKIEIPKKLPKQREVCIQLRDDFVEAVEAIPEEKDEELPESVILMYNFLVEDELEESDEEEKEASVSPAEEELKKVAENPSKTEITDKKEFVEELISQAKYTVSEIADLCVEKFGGKKSTYQTLVYDARNPKYNRLSKLVIIEDRIVKFK